jgi:hypothetical protein
VIEERLSLLYAILFLISLIQVRVQTIIRPPHLILPFQFQGTILGAKFDDASVALGAALLANLKTDKTVPVTQTPGSSGLSEAEVETARAKELVMQVSSLHRLLNAVVCDSTCVLTLSNPMHF